jgi:hypothetical protein
MRNILFILLFLNVFISYSQEENQVGLDDINRIGLFVDVLDGGIFEGSAINTLTKKIDRMVLEESIGKSVDERFGIVCKPNIIVEDIYQSTPPKYIFEFDLDFYVVDYQEKVKFGVYSVLGLKGLNPNKQRALIQGIRSVNSNSKFSEFISDMKRKIIDYYISQCDFIIKESQTLADNDNFEESILKLSTIPQVCEECFDKSQIEMRKTYQRKLERECQEIVSEANSLIAREMFKDAASVLKRVLPGISCHEEAVKLIEKVENHWCNVNLSKARSFKSSRNFDEAAKYLSLVPLSSSCASEAKSLGDEIYSTLTEIDQRNWNFKLTKYSDQQEKELRQFDFEVNKFDRLQTRLDSDQKFEQDNFESIQKSKRDMQEILSNEAINVSKYNAKKKPETRNYSFLGF